MEVDAFGVRSRPSLEGRVFYTHGAGIDHPLAIGRLDSSPTVIIPEYDYRGNAISGYCTAGTLCTQLEWPEKLQSPWDQDPPPSDPLYGGPAAWSGNLIDTHKDGSGYVYMRNRYYDPSSGRFTQEDPIGLAGGLNAYGFANGDPVNYSDPFGLCPICLVVAGAALEGAIEGGILGAGQQMAENALSGTPLSEGVAKATVIGAGVGAVTAGVGSAARMLRAVSKAGRAVGFAEAKVASEAEANAAAETFAGKGSRPMVDRGSGRQVGMRNDATGNMGRTVHTDAGTPTPHANLENAAGGNTHVTVNPSGTKSWWTW
jgi:RHS repeat-associated protein